MPAGIFCAALLTYFAIGASLERAAVFSSDNLLFNADCARIWHDCFHAGTGTTFHSSAGHPFFVVLMSPLTRLLELALPGTGTLPGRLLCHLAAAGAAPIVYRWFVTLAVPRWYAACGAILFAASTSQLVAGSIIESFAFVAVVLSASLLAASRAGSFVSSALFAAVTFGVNSVLGIHALLAAPMLWLGKLSPLRWLRAVASFLCTTVLIYLCVAQVQERVYPGVGFFYSQNATESYHAWWSVPTTAALLAHRLERVLPHVFGFAQVAPVPIFTPYNWTTFMEEPTGHIARYDLLGTLVVVAWGVLGFVATVNNVRALFRRREERRWVIVVLGGWLFGVLGFFTLFGDDLLLYSSLWTLHVLAWVVLGTAPLARAPGRAGTWFRRAGFVFVAAVLTNNAVFVVRMLSQYPPS